MDRKIAKEWCKALRSGKYKQGSGYLKPATNTYCCLGVLCELAKKKGVIKDYWWEHGGLPIEVQKWAGIGQGGEFIVNEKEINLADLNDGKNTLNMKIPLKNGKKVNVRPKRKASFSTIANIIESYVEEL